MLDNLFAGARTTGSPSIFYRLFMPILAVFVLAGGVALVGEFAKNDSSATLSQSVEQTYPGDNKISPNAPYLAAANVGKSPFIAANRTSSIVYPQCYFRPELESGKSFSFNCERAQAVEVRKIDGGDYGVKTKYIEGSKPLDLCKQENDKQLDKYNLSNKNLCRTLIAMGYADLAFETRATNKSLLDAITGASNVVGDYSVLDSNLGILNSKFAQSRDAKAARAAVFSSAALYFRKNSVLLAYSLSHKSIIEVIDASKDQRYCSILKGVGKMVEKSQKEVFAYIDNKVCVNYNNNNESCSKYNTKKADARSKLREMKKAIDAAYKQNGVCYGMRQTTEGLEKAFQDDCKAVGGTYDAGYGNENLVSQCTCGAKIIAPSLLQESGGSCNSKNNIVCPQSKTYNAAQGQCVLTKQQKTAQPKYKQSCENVGGTYDAGYGNENLVSQCKCGSEIITPSFLQGSGGFCKGENIVCQQGKTYNAAQGRCVPKQKAAPTKDQNTTPKRCGRGQKLVNGKCTPSKDRLGSPGTAEDEDEELGSPGTAEEGCKNPAQCRRQAVEKAKETGKAAVYPPKVVNNRPACLRGDKAGILPDGRVMCIVAGTVTTRPPAPKRPAQSPDTISRKEYEQRLAKERERAARARAEAVRQERQRAQEALRRQAQENAARQRAQAERYRQAQQRAAQQRAAAQRAAQQRAQQARAAQRPPQTQQAPPSWIKALLDRLRGNRQPQFPAIVAKPQCISFTADKNSINAGDEVTLQWAVTGATKIIITPKVRIVEENGKKVAKVNPQSSVQYTLIATNDKGEENRCTTNKITVIGENDPESNLSCQEAIGKVSIGVTPSVVSRPPCDPELDQQACDDAWKGEEITVKWEVEPNQCVTNCKIQLQEENSTEWVDIWKTPTDMRYTLDSSQPGFSNKGFLRETSTFKLYCEDGFGNVKEDTIKARVEMQI